MDDAIIKIAVEALELTEAEAMSYNKPVPEIDGWYFWSPTRGGRSLLVNKDQERLIATSAVTFDAHVKAFENGRRN